MHCYRILEKCCNQGNKFTADFEEILADIQLFGSKEQVEMARKVIIDMAENSHSSPNELLKSLRDELREILDLPPINQKILHLRAKDTQKTITVKKI